MLITTLYRAVSKFESNLPAGLSFAQYVVLSEIAAKESEVTISSLRDRLGVNATMISRALKNLTVKGLALAKYKDDNNRTLWLSVTEKGKKVLQDVPELLTLEESERLESLLMKLVDELG